MKRIAPAIALPGIETLTQMTWLFLMLLCSPAAHAQRPAAAPASGNWPCYRGPDRMGIAPPGNETIPLEWGDTKNIIWKTVLPGRGASSPIVWGHRIYLTAFTGYAMEKGDPHSNIPKLVRHLLCVNRDTGAIRWKADMPAGSRHEHGMSDFLYLHGYASSTPVADESGVYVYLGRAGIHAFDHAGKQRWEFREMGKRDHSWGSAASPIIFENLLIVHADPDSEAIIALDKANGREVWRAATGKGDSWSTPLIVTTARGPELVFHHSTGASEGKVAAVNPSDGAALWECNVLKDYLCPSPLARDGVIYWMGYQRVAAVRAGGRGDVTASHLLWETTRSGSSVCTPVLHGDHLYWTDEESGLAMSLDAKTGKLVYQERLDPKPGRIYASGVLVGDRIFYVSRENGTYVIEAKPAFRQLAHNRIESDKSVFNGTPAISRGRLFLRSDRFLYCIGKK